MVVSKVIVCRAPARKSFRGREIAVDMYQYTLVSVIASSEVVVVVLAQTSLGDVRLASAVDLPELPHLKNVIVFSTQGERDLPNMCVMFTRPLIVAKLISRLGGGDLDGDGKSMGSPMLNRRFHSHLG